MDNNANQNINKADLIAALKVNIKAAADIISMPAEEKREIYKLYGVVIKALGKLSSDPNKVTSPEQLETIENQNKIQANPELFGILSNPVFYTCMFSGDMKDYFSDPSKINLPVVNKKDNPYYQFFKTLDSFKKRMNRLSSLGVVPNYSFDVADLRMLYGVYKDQQVEKIDITKGEPEKEEVAFDDEEILKEIEEDSKKQQEEAEKEAEKQLTEEDIEDQSFEEYEKSLQKFKTQINNQVKAITDVLTTLYASGFSAIAQTGILCQLDDSPVAQLKEINGHYGMFTLVDENLSNDQLILEILKEKVPEFDVYPNIDGKDAVPPTSFLLNNNGICNILHLQFQKASIRAVTGLISIRRFITATQLEKSGCRQRRTT
jgi:hypothetical protein